MTRHDDPPAAPGATKRQRIAKLMARAGLCSRRDAEAWIVEGRVSVNGATITSPALDVDEGDAILVDGMPIPTADKTRLFLFHKPRGLVTSDHDPEGRATVADFLRDHWPEGPRVVTIGRLDINTEGLLLLTNDGGLARILELPQTGWVRRYRVRAKGEANPAMLEALAAGVTIDGIDYAGIEAKLDRVQGANCWLTMGLREGKNREVKRVLEHIGLEVNRLIRLSFGPFQLLELPEGAVEEVRTRVLRDQLGENLAAQAGVDFGETEPVTAPAREARPARAPRAKPTGERGAQPARDARTLPAGRPARPAGDRPMRPRPERRDDRNEAPAPVRERPAAGTRKHVSTLRASESEAARKGPRRRTERTDTQDRRDRTIKVERLVSARPTPERAAPKHRRPGAADPNIRVPRGGGAAKTGRFDAPDAGRRPEGRSPHRDFARGAKRRPEPDRAARPVRGEDDHRRDATRPARGDERPARAPSEGPRRHVSPSALGKRERMSRSGPAPERSPSARAERSFSANKDRRRQEAETGGSRRPDADKRSRPPRAEPRTEGRPDSGARDARRPGPDKATRPRARADDRRESGRTDPKPRRDDTSPRSNRAPGARPTGAASRKPNSRKGPPGGAARPTGSRPSPARGKPPSRGPSKPKR